MIQTANTFNSPPRRRIPKKVWIPLIILFIFFSIPVLLLGWMGLVPGLSNLMGSANQRDLGVAYSQNDVTTSKKKIAVSFKDYELAPASPVDFSDKQVFAKPVTVENLKLTQEEVTAIINSYNWSWMPVDHIQIRMSEDTLELSGTLNTKHIASLKDYIANGQPLNSEVSSGFSWASKLRNNAPVYIKLRAGITDNILSFKLIKAEIGRMSIPLGSANNNLKSGTMTNIDGQYLRVQSAALHSGHILFTGTYPSVIYVKP